MSILETETVTIVHVPMIYIIAILVIQLSQYLHFAGYVQHSLTIFIILVSYHGVLRTGGGQDLAEEDNGECGSTSLIIHFQTNQTFQHSNQLELSNNSKNKRVVV